MLLEKCVWTFCLNVCLCSKCTPSAWGGQKRASVPLKLMFQMVVGHCVDGGNWTWLLCKNRQCSEPLGSLSGLIYTLKMTLFSNSVQEWTLRGQSQRAWAPWLVEMALVSPHLCRSRRLCRSSQGFPSPCAQGLSVASVGSVASLGFAGLKLDCGGLNMTSWSVSQEAFVH